MSSQNYDNIKKRHFWSFQFHVSSQNSDNMKKTNFWSFQFHESSWKKLKFSEIFSSYLWSFQLCVSMNEYCTVVVTLQYCSIFVLILKRGSDCFDAQHCRVACTSEMSWIRLFWSIAVQGCMHKWDVVDSVKLNIQTLTHICPHIFLTLYTLVQKTFSFLLMVISSKKTTG